MANTVIYSDSAPQPIGPYSQAIFRNNVLYVSGQIAINPETNELVTDSIEAETNQVMHNIEAILMAGKLSLANVVKCTIFVRDLNDFAKINHVYGKYFATNPPARETVEVSRLPKDVNVEISCIAVA